MMLRVGELGKGQGRRRLHEVGEGGWGLLPLFVTRLLFVCCCLCGGSEGVRLEGGLGDDGASVDVGDDVGCVARMA